jgi:16S rRNA (uracil1498-N3)-methyltransferase
MATHGGARGTGSERAWHAPLPAAGRVTLDADESAHLVRVRRVHVGESVVLFDGAGVTRRARLVVADPRAAALEVEGDAEDREPTRALTLAVSPPEPARADELVQSLAWLGVTRLVPLLCERTPRGRGDLVLRRRTRWERLAREAAKGNGRSRLLVVGAPTALTTLLAAPPPEGLVLLDPDPGARPLLGALPGTRPFPWLLVGPEGGFTAAEVTAAGRVGANVARLGPTALRVELAAIAAASVALAGA